MAISLADAALGRALGAPKARNSYAVRAVRMLMRDGVMLVGDHYAPDTRTPRGTLLVRTPYGRGFPIDRINGAMFAARGYHVVIQSVRGTFGSGGTFEPTAQETADGHDTIGWLRAQPWFDGRIATVGGSYLGWTQWAVLQDPPPEIKTAVIYIAPHDFSQAVFGRGPFTVGDFLSWTSMMTTQEDGGLLRRAIRGAISNRRLAPYLAGLPLPDAADPLLKGRAPWYRSWLSHPDTNDPWWTPYQAGAALGRVSVPILLVGGWQDLFLDQTLEQYLALRDRGVDVALTVGPWTHLDTAAKATRRISRETLDWLDAHLYGDGPARDTPVHVYRTGEAAWHRLTSWPPATTPVSFRLTANGSLIREPHPTPEPSPAPAPGATIAAEPRPTPAPGPTVAASPTTGPRHATEAGAAIGPGRGLDATGDADVGERPGADVITFRYDPADPTPSIGGRTLSGSMGIKDNRALEARPDVLVFTSEPLTDPVDITGQPVVDLDIAVDNPYADVFLRLCDVDRRGRSHNVADRLRRLDPAGPAGQVQRITVALDPCFHRLLPGHRLRLQISGGAFPRYARNLGTDGTPAAGRTLQPARHDIHLAGCRVTLHDDVSPSSDAPSTTR